MPVALVVIALDQLTKRWALDNLLPGPCSQPDACIDLVFGARFHLVFNNGAAFSRGTGAGPLLGVLAFIMAGVLLYLATKRPDRLGVALFGLVAGGAVGNLLDRFFRADDGFLSGAVVDFVDLGWWPVFNVADSAIVVGVVAIIAHAFLVGEGVAEGPESENAPASESGVDDDPDLADTDLDGVDGRITAAPGDTGSEPERSQPSSAAGDGAE